MVLALIPYLAGNVTLVNADTTWTGADPGDDLWSTAANWSDGVPDEADVVTIASPPEQGPVIDLTVTAICAAVDGPGHESQENNSMDVTGGSFTVLGDWSIGKQGSPTVNVSGGTVDIGDDLNVGPKGGEVTFNMTGGKINASGSLIVARKSGAIATFNMHGGAINCDDIQIAPQDDDTIGVLNLFYGSIDANGVEIATEGGSSLLNVQAGTLIINGDAKAIVEGYINNGWITAYRGYGTLHLDYDVTNPGRTTLEATHMLNPNPADGSTVSAGPTQLQWTLPEPDVPGGIVTCDVYFGTNPDVEANPKVVVRQAVESVPVALNPQTNYYWALDLYDSSISATEPFYLSPISIFNTINTAPVVNAGDDVVTWLDNGERVVQLDGVVSDADGGPGPATLLWTVIAEPNELNPATFDHPNLPNPSVTVKEPGSYTLQLEAGDGRPASDWY